MSDHDLDKLADELEETIKTKMVRDPKTVNDLATNMKVHIKMMEYNFLAINARDTNTTACIIEIRERIDTTRAQMATMLSKIEELAQAIYGRN